MSETRVITSGNLATLFGFFAGLLGSIDDDTLKGVGISIVLENPGIEQFNVQLASAVPFDFIGQQLLVGETTYFLKDAVDITSIFWNWGLPFIGTDLEDGFLSSTPVTVVFNISSVNTFFNSAINSDINTPIPFPPHFDNR